MLVAILGLLGFNLLMLWGLERELFWRQAQFWFLGGAIFYSIRRIDRKDLFSHRWIIYLFALGFLSLPLIIGQVIRGSNRWLNLAGWSIQPSELVKPWLIGFLADYLSQKRLKTFGDFFLLLFLLGLPVFLVLIQPDLGSAAVMTVALVGLVFLVYPRWSWWLAVILISLGLGLVFGSRIIHPYQWDRVVTFLNPYQDPLGKGYNLIQARLAIGSGGWLGRGFGLGRQTQLAYLPERHTDFIFATIAEELGFIGVVFLLFFYYHFFYHLTKKIFTSRDKFFFYLRMGVFIQLLAQTSVNLAMNLGLFPVVGLPLPLVSYGGSSLISTLFSLALII